MRELSQGTARPPRPCQFHTRRPLPARGSLGAGPNCALCAWPVPSLSQMVVLLPPVWHRGVDLAAQAPGGNGTDTPLPTILGCGRALEWGCRCGSALLELLAKGLNYKPRALRENLYSVSTFAGAG